MKVIIELEFEENSVSTADVEAYLKELMANDCLDWYVKDNDHDYQEIHNQRLREIERGQ
tara:strand:- start:228 stop:404 length:177 start_codon:yes stop_codon:yes gene_type:complete